MSNTNNVEFETQRRRLLDRLKDRFNPGSMRPQLYLVMEDKGHNADDLKLEWMHHYAGMDSYTFEPPLPGERDAADSLLKQGWIVAAVPYKHPNTGEKIRRIQLLEDLHWGLAASGDAIIYNLEAEETGEDMIILADVADPIFQPAVAALRHRIEQNKVGYLPSIQLSNTTRITPLCFDESIIKATNRAHNPLRQMGTNRPNHPS